MAGTNDFLPFAVDPSANVEPQGSWAGSGTQTLGFQSGIVFSPVFNKALRQANLLGAALAQAIANQFNLNMLDDGDFATLLAHVTQSVQSLPGGTAHQIPYQSAAGVTSFIPAPTTAGQALFYDGTNLSWGTSGGGFTTNGYSVLGNGLILQWGRMSFGSGGSNSASLPMTFPNAALNAQATLINPTGLDSGYDEGAQVTSISTTSISVCMGTYGGGSATFPADAFWYVLGW